MNKAHFTLFISDLHLDPNTPEITHYFTHFLQAIAPQADALYILGDFFEAYIGDDDTSPFLKNIQQHLLTQTQKGLPIYLMHGNRDFLIGKQFAQATGVTLIKDPTCIDLYGQPYLLTHGDKLCTLDTNHQRFRRITSNRIIQKLFLSLPLSFRQKIAAQMRKESQAAQHHKSMAIMDVTQQAVIACMQQHQTFKMIHGHTHQQTTHEFDIDSNRAQRIVLDSWHHHGHYLKISDDGQINHVTEPYDQHPFTA